jgi:uncharacterized protein (DUF2384 family)
VLASASCGFRIPDNSRPQSVSMPQRIIRWVNAKDRRPHAQSIPQRAWEEHRGLLRRMYLEEDMKLENIMKIMKDEYSFTPIRDGLSKLFAFLGGVSIPPSSITGGGSTKGQAEAQRTQIGLRTRSWSRRHRQQNQVQLLVLGCSTATLTKPRNRK